MFESLEDQEFEIKCPNDGCYGKIRTRYSDAFNGGRLSCYDCGAQVQLDPGRMSQLHEAVNDAQRAKSELEKAEQDLRDAVEHLFDGAQLTKKL